MNIINIFKLIHEYKEYDDEENEIGTVRALDGVDLEIKEGSFVTVLGHNGSGKSTLAKHMNALLLPTEGTVVICGYDTQKDENLYEVRQSAGMIFQNPDNQIIGNIIEEDVAFGPENMGIKKPELAKRVDEALEKVGMAAFRFESPNRMSGGQKQRIGIAGVLAMKPKCILMDEPTAMLDPLGRKEVIETVRELNRKENITVILITHYMEEAVLSDRVIVMDKGRIVMDGTPKEIFSRVDELNKYHMTVPQATLLAYGLKKEGLCIPDGILDAEELADEIMKLV